MKKIIITVLMLLVASAVGLAVFADGSTLAFPGAEGGGKYSPGARGALPDGELEVYHVTRLDDSGSGSLRDAVSKSGRIVVFDISGTIELKSDINMNKDNITILGQTAPGDGVTVSGGSIVTGDGVKNIIIRYLKVRPTDKNGGEPDGIGGRYGTDIIFDHVSTSWCVDELLTLYAGPAQEAGPDKPVGNHLTIQNTIGSESLRMSNHTKGAHGYGAILGGTYASYLNNLLAHHDSRSPRLDRQLVATEFSNNVIYNWGQTNSAYGAEPYSSANEKSTADQRNPSHVNWVGNYYKSGPSTRATLKTRVFDVTEPLTETDRKSVFYFDDNYIEGTGTVTNYKNNSIVNNYIGAEFADSEIDMGSYKYDKTSPEEARELILSTAGATLPRRDANDARIVNDVINGTGRVINNAGEVGGLIPVESETRKFEIPADWLASSGYTGMAETDITENGYTVIEEYVNYLTEELSKTPPTNANIIVQSPAIAALSNNIEGMEVDNGEWAVITEGEPLRYKATAIPRGGNEVVKMELYDGNTKLSEFDGKVIDTEVSLPAGEHYLTCRAINTRGEKTQSTTSIVYVKSAAAPGSYSFEEIKESSYKGYAGKGGASMDEKGVYTIYGSGRITTKANDSCGFMYKEVTGDFDVTVRVEEIPKFENQQVSGLMVRAGLASNDIMAMIGDGWWKYGENMRIYSRAKKGATATETFFKDKNGKNCDNETDETSYSMPKYMRIQRNGNSLTFSVSNMGIDWTDNDRQPVTIEYDNLPDTMYVGLATDSASGVSVKEYFSIAKFSRLTLNGESDVTIEEGKVPFTDEDFDNTEWYNAIGEVSDLQTAPRGGNSSVALLFWGEAYRSFKPQDEGVITATADFYTSSNSRADVNQKAGARFMLSGTDKDGNTVKIKSVYAQHDQGFFIDYDEVEPRPTAKPYSDSKFELEKWYKVEMTLNYDTGKGTYSFKPYEKYDSSIGVYETGEPIFEYEFDFDTSIPLTQLHFERRGGYEMYLDNVGVSVYKRPIWFLEGGKPTVDRAKTDASVIIAYYDESGTLTDAQYAMVAAGETKSVELNVPLGAYSAKAFLWDKNMEPLGLPLEPEIK